ncbi:hypothetical protein BDC45DRAFT_492697 [Circinella umbellata]|nr:hypothetical protein BDC45DRAFT_492697 [Circinella umbellata]
MHVQMSLLHYLLVRDAYLYAYMHCILHAYASSFYTHKLLTSTIVAQKQYIYMLLINIRIFIYFV